MGSRKKSVEERIFEIPEFERLWKSIQEADWDREAKRVRADPKGHKTTRCYDRPLRYRYFAGKTLPNGDRSTYCYATVPNLAGYYLTWTEVEHVKERKVERLEHQAHRTRRAAKAYVAGRSET